jgi:hypothetical protein
VEVIVLFSDFSASRRSAIDILAEAPGQRLFKTAADVEAYLQHEASQRDLIGEGVLCLSIQFIGMGVDHRQVRGVFSRTRPSEIGAQGGCDELIPLRRIRSTAIQGGLEIVW